MKNYCVCENCGGVADLVWYAMERGERAKRTKCKACFTKETAHHIGKIEFTEHGKKSVTKDFINTYSFSVLDVTPRGHDYFIKHGFVKGFSRYHSRKDTKLNSAIRCAPYFEKLIKSGDICLGNGKIKIVFSSELFGLEREYSFNYVNGGLQNFIREAEYQFACECDIPQWSALKTGTRKAEG